MKSAKPSETYNFALVGHAGDGKTSLGEAILHVAGARAELGRVTDGSSCLNYLPEEKERHHTISSAIFAFDWNDRHLTLVDTPGDSNFQAEGRIALHALDGAVLVVSAVGGAKVGAQRMVVAAKALGLPILAFVSGIDREHADFDAAVEALRGLDLSPVVLTLPLGTQAQARGIVDLLGQRVVTADGAGAIPDELSDIVQGAREALVEAVAECDDVLLEKYLDSGELADDEVLHGLVAGTRSGRLVPVLCGSGTAEIGVAALLDALVGILPSAEARGAWPARDADGAEIQVEPSLDAPFSAIVFKTIIDRYAGTLSVLRIVSGRLTPDGSVQDASVDQRERIGKLLLLRGEEHVDVPEAGPGDIVAVAKLKATRTGHALTSEKGGVHLAEIPIPQGVISYAIQPKARADEDKLYTSLARLVEEDPTLHVGREASTGEFLLSGMGELHVRTTAAKLHRLFGVDVELKRPKVPYRETVTRRAENVEGKLKKQTGGKGMFGVCYLTVEPKPRGEGVEFSDEIVGGAIPRNLIPAVEKGVMEACTAGPLAGYPVVDLRVRCVDGKHHAVDSNEMAFKLAGSFGFKAAVEKAHPTLLEPIMRVEITVPSEFVGDILGDVSQRRGRVQSSESRGSGQVIQAQVPMAEMLEYASALTSLTGGQGEFHMEFSHYDEAPAQVREKVIAEASAARAAS
jgi:elongation factor G